LAEPGEPAERLRGIIATADFFPALGVAAALGRTFTTEANQPRGKQSRRSQPKLPLLGGALGLLLAL